MRRKPVGVERWTVLLLFFSVRGNFLDKNMIRRRRRTTPPTDYSRVPSSGTTRQREDFLSLSPMGPIENYVWLNLILLTRTPPSVADVCARLNIDQHAFSPPMIAD